MSEKIHRNSLKPGHKLHWYRIEKILGQGGFGITYLAYDFNLDRNAAIKEYLPIELAVREGDFSVHPMTDDHGKQFHWGLDRFLSEARTLAKFEHPNIVRVLNVFEENNTAYMVMSYEEGDCLQELLSNRKTLEEDQLMNILFPILGGLDEVHKTGFIHRDIKPANIFIRKDGSPVLLDFGSARQALGEQTKTLTSLISPGYAPFEQYYSKSDAQGPWTDIYGMGATLYRAISGLSPTDAVDRSRMILQGDKDNLVSAMEIGKGRYSERFLAAIDHALEFKEKDRPQTIAEWKSEFNISTPGITKIRQDQKDIPTEVAPSKIHQLKTEKIESPQTQTPPAKSKIRTFLFLLLLVILAGVGWKFYHNHKLKQFESTAQQEPAVIEEPVAVAKEENKTAQQIEQLLTDAQMHFDALRLTTPEDNNALQSYNKVLELDPENTEAKQGINSIADKLVSLAQHALAVDDFEQTENYLNQAKDIMPDAANIKLAQDELNLKKTALEKKHTLAMNLLEETKKAIEQGDALTVLSNLEKARSLGVKPEKLNVVRTKLKEKLGSLAAEEMKNARTAMKAKDTVAARQALKRAKVYKNKSDKIAIE